MVGGGWVMLFVQLWRIAYENRYVTNPWFIFLKYPVFSWKLCFIDTATFSGKTFHNHF